MHSEFLGSGYHNLIRSWLKVPKVMLTDDMIDSDLNVGAAQMMMGTELLKPFLSGEVEMSERTDRTAQLAFKHFLCASLCPVLISRVGQKQRFNEEAQRHIKEGRILALALK